MTTEPEVRRTLSESAARQLANATKTRPQWSGITPRWLVSFLPWAPVEAGIYRLNRVKEATALSDADVQCSPARDRDADLPETFVDYEDAPREYSMNAVTTILDVQTRVSDLYNHPYDQIQEQVRLLTEKVKEKQESELINNAEYGFLANAHPSMKISHAHRRAAARRSRRTHREGLEGARLLSRASARHRGLRARMHAPRRAAADRDAVRLALRHLARPAAGAERQALHRRGGQDENSAAAHRREETGRRRPVSAGRPGRSRAEPVGALHGNQSQGDRLLSHLALLLGGRADA